jgi:hypothetical protein
VVDQVLISVGDWTEYSEHSCVPTVRRVESSDEDFDSSVRQHQAHQSPPGPRPPNGVKLAIKPKTRMDDGSMQSGSLAS